MARRRKIFAIAVFTAMAIIAQSFAHERQRDDFTCRGDRLWSPLCENSNHLKPGRPQGAAPTGWLSRAAIEDNCLACHKTKTPETVALYSSSVHAAKGYECNRCHGGDAMAADKAQAHAGNFTGQPSPSEVVTMCGSCHRAQSASFKTGKHFPRGKEPRVDCSQCHGAHAVGSLRNFSFVYYCAGCHGQEYLPQLPDNFQKMLALADALSDAGNTISEDATQRRKEIRRRIGEIVHPTDFEGARTRTAEILKLGEEFKQMIEKK
ncbi:MAG: cytochrome c3 family protein [Acidobacteriota bacterium]